MTSLVRAAHPGPAVAVTAFTAVVAAAAGARAPLLAAAVLAGQLSVGWCNDWADRASDVAASRTDKPIARGEVSGRAVGAAAVAALAATVPLSLAAGVAAGLAHLVAVAFAWSYNLWLKRTPASPVPFFVAFGLVPPWFVGLSLPGSPSPRPAVWVASGLLGVSAHLTNTIKDTDADRAIRLRGLPQRLGPTVSAFASAGLLAAAAGLLLASAGSRTVVSVVAAGLAAALAVAYCVVVASGRRTAAAFALNVLAVGAVLVAYVSVGGSVLRA